MSGKTDCTIRSPQESHPWQMLMTSLCTDLVMTRPPVTMKNTCISLNINLGCITSPSVRVQSCPSSWKRVANFVIFATALNIIDLLLQSVEALVWLCQQCSSSSRSSSKDLHCACNRAHRASVRTHHTLFIVYVYNILVFYITSYPLCLWMPIQTCSSSILPAMAPSVRQAAIASRAVISNCRRQKIPLHGNARHGTEPFTALSMPGDTPSRQHRRRHRALHGIVNAGRHPFTATPAPAQSLSRHGRCRQSPLHGNTGAGTEPFTALSMPADTPHGNHRAGTEPFTALSMPADTPSRQHPRQD
jgi:hypothetical protein